MACLTLLTSACGPSTPSPTITPAELGRLAFNDPQLSASGKQSCASCHAPETGHAAPNALAVQTGGAALTMQGLRASQPLRYLLQNTAFRLDSDGAPSGGFFWDGRANSLAEQAASPLLGMREMANGDKASVVAKVQRTAWAGDFQRLFGADIFQDPELAFAKLLEVLQSYQLADAQFNAFTSKYDAVLRGQIRLSEQESRGLALFNAPDKGNCAACHPSEKGSDGQHPLFTDFSYDNLGVPRNPEIAANADQSYFDLGLCARPDLADRTDLCGAFRVPSLRNVALRKSYFHNGKFKTLADVLRFYVQRDTHPDKWYPKNPDGSVRKFDDLPASWQANVNTTEVPYDRQLGQVPRLSEADMEDVIAFLQTLSDGWTAP